MPLQVLLPRALVASHNQGHGFIPIILLLWWPWIILNSIELPSSGITLANDQGRTICVTLCRASQATIITPCVIANEEPPLDPLTSAAL
jgi:hypothetical protein